MFGCCGLERRGAGQGWQPPRGGPWGAERLATRRASFHGLLRSCGLSPSGTPSTATEPWLFLVGPTAVGKTELGLELARELGAEIVSLDSMQVYRGLDIGTAKPTPAERARVPHHLLDLVGPDERYDVSRYLRDAEAAVQRLATAGRRALFVGGTGLYLKVLSAGLFDGPPTDLELRARLQQRVRASGLASLYAELLQRDPASAARLHPHDEKRVLRALEVLEQSGRTLSDWQREWSDPSRARATRIVGLTLDFERLEERIGARVEAMLDAGWSDEARAVAEGPGFGPTAIQALGYREVLALSRGELTRAACVARITQLTRRFAKKQHTWYRSFPAIHWLDPRNETARAEARAVLAGERPRTSGS